MTQTHDTPTAARASVPEADAGASGDEPAEPPSSVRGTEGTSGFPDGASDVRAASVPSVDGGPPPDIEIFCSPAAASLVADVDRLADRLRAVAVRLGVASGSMRLRIVDDAEMAELHGRYGGPFEPTDVLTFDLADPDLETSDADVKPPPPALEDLAVAATPARRSVDCDVVVDVEEAARQSAWRGHPVDEELLLYALHGLLHALGLDDHDDDDFRRMHGIEDHLLGELGVTARFAAPGPAVDDDAGSAGPTFSEGSGLDP